MLAAKEGAGEQKGLHGPTALSYFQLPAHTYNELHLCGLKPASILGHFTSCSPSSRRH